jgi:hypothetical protein
VRERQARLLPTESTTRQLPDQPVRPIQIAKSMRFSAPMDSRSQGLASTAKMNNQAVLACIAMRIIRRLDSRYAF